MIHNRNLCKSNNVIEKVYISGLVSLNCSVSPAVCVFFFFLLCSVMSVHSLYCAPVCESKIVDTLSYSNTSLTESVHLRRYCYSQFLEWLMRVVHFQHVFTGE